ncbi:MAG: TraB/GumN family protein [Proteobacteria bacterium]|nr:TraB/GumN family protein [Pseudomonadota bacterium]
MNIKDSLADQPHQIITRNNTTYTVLGTAHISKKSAQTVKQLIDTQAFDVVAIELDELRYQALTDTNRYKNMDLISIIKNKQVSLVATNLVMGAYQKKLADQLGVEPGAEMKQAIESAKEYNLSIWNIDRSVGLTMKRTWRSLSFFEKINLIFGFGGFFDKEEISEEEIEKLKSGDMLKSTFVEFSENSGSIFKTLIDERDLYMAARLQSETNNHPKDEPEQNVLVVIGAGHLEGLCNYLKDDIDTHKTINELNTLPNKSNWGKYIPWIITVLIISGFIWGFSTNKDLGLEMIKIWLIYNGVLSAIGAALAGGHPLTILAAMLAAPFTSLNPLVGAGMVSALVETYLRKPVVSDFERLQQDATNIKGFWTNPVTRILLVFILTNLGSGIATWVSGFKIYSQLI